MGASDTLLEEHRSRGGLVPCVRSNPAFRDRCTAHYTDQALARALPDQVYVEYGAAKDAVIENRHWQQCNQRLQEEAGFKLFQDCLEVRKSKAKMHGARNHDSLES